MPQMFPMDWLLHFFFFMLLFFFILILNYYIFIPKTKVNKNLKPFNNYINMIWKW
uniref:ATP synthase F0 subunit 8 n=1 Tax=Hypsathalia przewalskyi TaxID=1428813 RepID=UPI0022009CEB|nr:ATP synthase F0 subunit 8 [Hypsathalia przewalskyi]UXW93428.1 ATP synthase F0 subunit 8 [Hypsathalia przewalskyi]